MKKLISCEFNIDTACVELRYSDGSMLAIDCDAVEWVRREEMPGYDFAGADRVFVERHFGQLKRQTV